LDNVNFKTDPALYKKFKMINTILNEKNQTVITKLIENYVTENKKFIDNSEILEVIQQELPTFFGNAEEWIRYVSKLNENDYVNMVNRFHFFKYLLLNYDFSKHHDINFQTFLHDKNRHFKTTDDFRSLAHSGIYRNVNDDTDRYGTSLLGVGNNGL
jgi:hypothetical protein